MVAPLKNFSATWFAVILMGHMTTAPWNMFINNQGWFIARLNLEPTKAALAVVKEGNVSTAEAVTAKTPLMTELETPEPETENSIPLGDATAVTDEAEKAEKEAEKAEEVAEAAGARVEAEGDRPEAAGREPGERGVCREVLLQRVRPELLQQLLHHEGAVPGAPGRARRRLRLVPAPRPRGEAELVPWACGPACCSGERERFACGGSGVQWKLPWPVPGRSMPAWYLWEVRCLIQLSQPPALLLHQGG